MRAEAPVDVLLASEVIEHVADPHRFLDDITPTLAPDGWLVTSTPNAAGVSQDASPGALLPILTPGYHLVLFSETALRCLLEAHGFAQVEIRASETNLTALACRHPRPCGLSRILDRALYRDYLKRRLDDLDPDEPLAYKFSGRLIKEYLDAGDIEAAQAECDPSRMYTERTWIYAALQSPLAQRPRAPPPRSDRYVSSARLVPTCGAGRTLLSGKPTCAQRLKRHLDSNLDDAWMAGPPNARAPAALRQASGGWRPEALPPQRFFVFSHSEQIP